MPTFRHHISLIFHSLFLHVFRYLLLLFVSRSPVPLKLGLVLVLLALLGFEARSQSLRKLERGAINRTHLTFVNGDTVQRFTVTYAHPTARPGRFYYWQGPTQILRTAGAYNGRLLTGDYQLTSRNGNLLGSGRFYEGLKAGQWRTWRPDGTPLASSRWRRGQQRGRTRYYNEAGQLLPPPAPAGAAPTKEAVTLHAWQPAYWRQALRRRQQRRAARRRAPAAPPPAPAAPAKAGPAAPTVPRAGS
jgi:hypothetical protein